MSTSSFRRPPENNFTFRVNNKIHFIFYVLIFIFRSEKWRLVIRESLTTGRLPSLPLSRGVQI